MPDPHTIRKLAVESYRSEATVRRWLAGKPVNTLTAHAIEAAASRIGLPPPPGPKAA